MKKQKQKPYTLKIWAPEKRNCIQTIHTWNIDPSSISVEVASFAEEWSLESGETVLAQVGNKGKIRWYTIDIEESTEYLYMAKEEK